MTILIFRLIHVSTEITFSKCLKLTNQLENSQMELKSLQLVIKLLQTDSEQNNVEPVVTLRHDEYKN